MEKGIDKSLSLLKTLESRLQGKCTPKQDKNTQLNCSKNMKTEPVGPFMQRPQPEQHLQEWNRDPSTQGTIPRSPALIPKEKERIPRPVAEDNKKLKKYIKCLIKMNDYLKQQLAEKQTCQSKVDKKYAKSETDLLKIEIDYLKELNCDKELEILRYRRKIQSGSRHKRSSSKSSVWSSQSKISDSCQYFHHNHCSYVSNLKSSQAQKNSKKLKKKTLPNPKRSNKSVPKGHRTQIKM